MTYSKRLLALTLFTVKLSVSYAGNPLWTLTPLTATTIDLPSTSTATVQYQITNQSSRSHTLALNPIKGVTQLTGGAGICSNSFTLSGKSSCVLSLQVDGSQIVSGNTNGPIVCEANSNMQCYRPNINDTLNVTVTTAADPTTLSASVSTLSLRNNGIARIIIITNTGSFPALNVSVNHPAMPSGTSVTSNCSATLNAGASCTVTITPGNNATSNCGSGQGSAPMPDTITVSANNVVSSTTTDVVVLAYGCIYQQGYVFGIDDSTPTSTSVLGKIASLASVSSGIRWYNGSYLATGASSLTDGALNTSAIISAQGAGSYAASICNNYTVDSSGNSPCSTGTCYSNWYLPAICQLNETGGNPTCPPGVDNIQTNLPGLITGCSGPECLSNNYWSSTQISNMYSWYQYFSPSYITANAAQTNDSTLAARCVRDIT